MWASVFAQLAVDLKFFSGESGEHVMVATPVGFGDEGAEFALTTFKSAMRESVEGVLDLLSHGLCVGGG